MNRRMLLAMVAVLLATNAYATEIKVVSSGGFAAAYKVLAPEFEKASGDTLATGWGPSMGVTKDAVPVRLARGEPIDVVIMVGYALGVWIPTKAATFSNLIPATIPT